MRFATIDKKRVETKPGLKAFCRDANAPVDGIGKAPEQAIAQHFC